MSSEVVPDARQEFWRSPLTQPAPDKAKVCEGCGSEFMAGAHFCYSCGRSRAAAPAAVSWTSYLEFHNIERSLGLSTAALVAFLVGIICLLMAAVAVGMIYSVQTFDDFQAVQLYRIQWLLAAIAAFVAGLLLKKAPGRKA